jgi:hypothetical protein
MSAAANENELTSTLHLGLRSVVDGSADNALARFLAGATSEEIQAYKTIAASDGNTSMIFFHRGPAKGSRYLLEKSALLTGVSIGRSKESDIFLDDVTVSRSHAKLTIGSSGVQIIDLGSLNGTYVNNVSLNEKPLISGDEIQIGKFHMLFVSSDSSSQTDLIEEK